MTDQWELGRRIEAARVAARLSKRQAAKRAGISDGRWRQLEAGHETVRGQIYSVKTTPATIARIASALGLPLDELLELAGLEPDSVADSGPAGLGVEVVDVAGLPASDVEKVQAFVQFLKQQNQK